MHSKSLTLTIDRSVPNESDDLYIIIVIKKCRQSKVGREQLTLKYTLYMPLSVRFAGFK